MPTSFLPAKKHITELDGLRCLAIVAVLAIHYRPPGDPFWRWASLGWVGVDLFFVISGYLITTILLGLRGKEHPYKTFYWRRAFRIFPPYYGYLLLVAVALRGGDWQGLRRAALFVNAIDVHSCWVIYQRILHQIPLVAPARPIHDPVFSGPGDGLTMIWSLSIEELFYLFWAPVVLRSPRKLLLWVAVLPMIICPILRVLGHTSDFSEYYQFIFRADALMFGAVVAILLAGYHGGKWEAFRLDRWIRVALWVTPPCLLALLWFDGLFHNIEVRSTYTFTAFGYSLCGIFFAGVVAWCVRHAAHADLASRGLRLRALTHIGKVSYGVYLIHVYAFVLVLRVARHMYGGDWMPGLPAGLLAALLAIGLASLSWHFVESPILRLKDRCFPSGSPSDNTNLSPPNSDR